MAATVASAEPSVGLAFNDSKCAESVTDDVYPRWSEVWCWCAVSPVLHVVAVAVAKAFDWLLAVGQLARIVSHVVPLPRE
jgi:hypothetical protein